MATGVGASIRLCRRTRYICGTSAPRSGLVVIRTTERNVDRPCPRLSRLGAWWDTRRTLVSVWRAVGCACGPRLLRTPPRSCLPVRFRLGLGRPSPDAPRLRFAPAFVVRTGSRMARTAERPRAQAGAHPAEHPNFGFGRSAHNTQPTTGTKLISTLQATPNVVRRISDLSTSLLGTRNLGHTASQLDNKEKEHFFRRRADVL